VEKQQILPIIRFLNSLYIVDIKNIFNIDNIKNLIDMGHSIKIERKGISGRTHNKRMEYIMSIINPAATGQVMISATRASLKQKSCCYSLLEILPIDSLYVNKQELLLRLIQIFFLKSIKA